MEKPIRRELLWRLVLRDGVGVGWGTGSLGREAHYHPLLEQRKNRKYPLP